MKLTFNSAANRFEAYGTEDEKSIPKSAGFTWEGHGKVWYTHSFKQAVQLLQFADELAILEIEKRSGKTTLTIQEELELAAKNTLKFSEHETATPTYEEAVKLISEQKNLATAFWYRSWLYGLKQKKEGSAEEMRLRQLPFDPQKEFGKKWRGWRAYLGIAPDNATHSYEELHELVKAQNFKSWSEYTEWARAKGYPVKPSLVYAADWDSAPAWLGKKLKWKSMKVEMDYHRTEKELLTTGRIKTPVLAGFWVKNCPDIFK